MIIRCPHCGAGASLETVIANDAAAEAIKLALEHSELGRSLVQYLNLFRPAKTMKLSWDRVARILNELNPIIGEKRIKRNGQIYEAPQSAWIWAINQMIIARDQGKLKTPLNGHGYLLEVLTSWKPEKQESIAHNIIDSGITHPSQRITESFQEKPELKRTPEEREAYRKRFKETMSPLLNKFNTNQSSTINNSKEQATAILRESKLQPAKEQ